MVKQMNEMGNRIRTKRLEKNLTMEELGNMLGVKASAINKYEKGIVENIKRPVIKKMSEIFECDPLWLMGFDGPQVATPVNPDPQQQYIDEAKRFYQKYLMADRKTRKMIDMLLEEGDE